MDWDYSKTWYHGSPLELKVIRKGSTITQDRDIARVFSHKPNLVSFSEPWKAREIKHTGNNPGFLYRISEEIGKDDVYPHPNSVMQFGEEWLTNRDLRVELICATEVIEEEKLTQEEIAELKRQLGK